MRTSRPAPVSGRLCPPPVLQTKVALLCTDQQQFLGAAASTLELLHTRVYNTGVVLAVQRSVVERLQHASTSTYCQQLALQRSRPRTVVHRGSQSWMQATGALKADDTGALTSLANAVPVAGALEIREGPMEPVPDDPEQLQHDRSAAVPQDKREMVAASLRVPQPVAVSCNPMRLTMARIGVFLHLQVYGRAAAQCSHAQQCPASSGPQQLDRMAVVPGRGPDSLGIV